MTLGRLATFLAILGISLISARELLKARPHTVSPHATRPESGPDPSPHAAATASAAPAPPPPPVTERQLDPLGAALCPDGMVLVDGTSCAETGARCLTPDGAHSGACSSYAPSVCRKGLALRFCVDRDEYPNIEGMLPATMITFEQAESACDEEGKRLCTEAEWSLACEGEAGSAFPYGNERDPAACNDGKPAPKLRPEELWEARDVAAVMDRVDARTASAALPGCVSAFGVRDMTGNVEEWVRSDTAGIAQALRGGEYTGFPTCRSVRKMRTPGFRQFHTGFRCCGDPLVRVPRRSAESGASGGPTVAPAGRFD